MRPSCALPDWRHRLARGPRQRSMARQTANQRAIGAEIQRGWSTECCSMGHCFASLRSRSLRLKPRHLRTSFKRAHLPRHRTLAARHRHGRKAAPHSSLARARDRHSRRAEQIDVHYEAISCAYGCKEGRRYDGSDPQSRSLKTAIDMTRHDGRWAVSVASCSSVRNIASRAPSSASEYICPRDHPLRAGGTFRMRQRLHQSAATSLRLVAMARSRIGKRSIVTVAAAMCVGQMSSTAAQCDRSIMSLANKDEHS